MEAHGVTSLPEEGASYPIEVALLKDQVTLAVDTSGAGLHKRGYRPVTGEAPLKETLAAGLILLSFWEPGRPFLDPFCGTGTLPIEAALIAGRRAPGLGRSFTAESWSAIPRRAWVLAREQAEAGQVDSVEATIRGSDQSARAIEQARANAARAGIGGMVRFERRAFEDIEPEADHGCLITNPPYGERLEDRESVRELYGRIPDVLRRFPSWSHYVLTSVPGFESILGQDANRRRKLYNGRIECTYYQFAGPRPGARAAEPSFGGVGERGERQLEDFANRLRKRARHLRKWPTKRGIEAFRIYDFDIKDVPIAVDRYADFALVTPAPRPVKSRTRAQHQDWLDAVVATTADVLALDVGRVRLHGRASETVTAVVIVEHGLRFEARLGGDDSTGLALEGRSLRAGRSIPSFFMRRRSVLGCSPRRSAALPTPLIRHAHASRVATMCWRSTSRSWLAGRRRVAGARRLPRASSRTRVRPGERIMARSTTFSSSRTLPGQS